MQAKEARAKEQDLELYSLENSLTEPQNTLWNQMQTMASSNASTYKGRTPAHHFPYVRASEPNRTRVTVAASTFI
ncbi:hypothetical protein C1H46_004550 [Malus baccata]|uniref:Uncharacterized protein n=1 Tax=Malus baccata TaxID=106549 RepID=A0A540NFJ3_MALBA|nr:hypothetical protein C1H46_004550 [Malus baccata]